jgi:tetratricopeptide (TPR) repeat protein
MELVPSGRTALQVLDGLALAAVQRLPATAVRLDAEILQQAPENADATMRMAARLVDDLEAADAAPWCSGALRATCLSEAIRSTDRAQRVVPRRCGPYVLRARARIATGDATIGLRELEAATDKVDDRLECLQSLAGLAQSAGDDGRTARAVDKVVRAGCSDDAVCVQNMVWAAQIEERRKEIARALVLYRKAHERAPDDDSILEAIARLASKAGLHAEAADAYRRLAERHPEQPSWRKAVQAERDEATRAPGQL